jgi:cytoskeletal protein CcmA (bactofilin family)
MTMRLLRRTATIAILTGTWALQVGGAPAATPASGKHPTEEHKPPTPPEPPAPDIQIPPDVPRPPKMPQPSVHTPRYNLAQGEVHTGDLYFMSDEVTISGKQDGDLMVFGRSLDVSGTVTGDINAWVQSADLSGKMGDAVRVFCQDVHVKGYIDGDLIAVCAEIVVDKDAHITGDLSAKGASVDVQGRVDGDFDATAGEVSLSGKVGGDATLKGDVIEVDPAARIDGSLEYTSRSPVDVESGKTVGKEVIYTPGKKKAPVSKGGFVKWFVLMSTALLSGLGVLAIFRKSAPSIVGLVERDALRSAGIGFITAIVVPVAAVLSCIFIITIPAALLVMLAYFLLIYLAQVPVAIWLGDAILKRFGRVGASPFLMLLLGVPVLYVIFSVPFIGKVALFAVMFTGFGAIVIAAWAARQARRAGGGATPAGEPPVAVVTG